MSPAQFNSSQQIPQRKDFPTYEQWDAHAKAYQMIFDLQAQVRALQQQLSGNGATSDIGRASSKNKTIGKSPSSALSSSAKDEIIGSKINGFVIKAGQPINGQTIRYNSTTGQFEFGT